MATTTLNVHLYLDTLNSRTKDAYINESYNEYNISSLPTTIANNKVTSAHEVVGYYISDPSAIAGDLTITTANGSYTISGTVISGKSFDITIALCSVVSVW